MGTQADRVYANYYENKKGNAGITITVPYHIGARIATGNTGARDLVIDAIITTVENRERPSAE